MMAAVRAADQVGSAQHRDGADGAALLSDARMRGPVHQPLAVELQHRLFERAHQVQVMQHAQQRGCAEDVPVLRHRLNLLPRRGVFQIIELGHPGSAFSTAS